MWHALQLLVIHYVGNSAGVSLQFQVLVFTQDIEQVRAYWQEYARKSSEEVDVILNAHYVYKLQANVLIPMDVE